MSKQENKKIKKIKKERTQNAHGNVALKHFKQERVFGAESQVGTSLMVSTTRLGGACMVMMREWVAWW